MPKLLSASFSMITSNVSGQKNFREKWSCCSCQLFVCPIQVLHIVFSSYKTFELSSALRNDGDISDSHGSLTYISLKSGCSHHAMVFPILWCPQQYNKEVYRLNLGHLQFFKVHQDRTEIKNATLRVPTKHGAANCIKLHQRLHTVDRQLYQQSCSNCVLAAAVDSIFEINLPIWRSGNSTKRPHGARECSRTHVFVST